jgi:YD repeat-containing protein
MKYLAVGALFLSVVSAVQAQALSPLKAWDGAKFYRPGVSMDFIPEGADVMWVLSDMIQEVYHDATGYALSPHAYVELWNKTDEFSQLRNITPSGDPHALLVDVFHRDVFDDNMNGDSNEFFYYKTTELVIGYCPLSQRFSGGDDVFKGVLVGAFCKPTYELQVEKNIGEPCPCVGNPINPAIGNKFQQEVDFDAGKGLSFVRYFDTARASATDDLAMTLGKGWMHNLGARIINRGYGVAYAVRSDGKRFRFVSNSSVWRSDPDVSDRLQMLTDASDNLTGWQYRYGKNQIDVFDADGRMISSGFENGYLKNLTYSDATTPFGIAPKAGLLIEVRDSFNRTLAFRYDADGRIVTITDPAGQEYQYGYNSLGDLVSVQAPGGAVRQYLYEDSAHPHWLTGIVDENGKRFATWAYSNGRAILSEHAGGAERVGVQYGLNRAEVTDALNKTETYRFQVLEGVRKTKSVSEIDRAENATYDANGNIRSYTNFNGHTVNYLYDLSRNLETSRTEAAGTPEARTITTEWHPTYRLPTRIAEPRRITTYTYDAKGNLLSKSQQATSDDNGAYELSATPVGSARTWEYTYNDFGQVLSANGPRIDVNDTTTYTYDTQGNLTSITDALGRVTTLSNYDAHGQVGRIVDPNGLTTDFTYSPRGWLTSRKSGDQLSTYDYDGVGQLTKATLPGGSTTDYTYDDAHRLTDIVDSAGNSIHYTLDPMGNRIKEEVKDPQGILARQITRQYDSLNRLQQITGGLQ